MTQAPSTTISSVVQASGQNRSYSTRHRHFMQRALSRSSSAAGTKEDEDFVEGHMLPNAHELVTRLRNHTSAVDVRLVGFEGKNHGTALPDWISQGIRTLLPSPPAASSH